MSERFNAGDAVYVIRDGVVSRKTTVARTTKTLAILALASGAEHRYDRESGRYVPRDAYHFSAIERPTPALDADFRAQRRKSAARRLAEAAKEFAGGSTTDTAEIERYIDLFKALAPLEP